MTPRLLHGPSRERAPLLVALATCMVATACTQQATPVAPPPAAAPTVVAAPPPPAPPRCVALSDGCTAKPDTELAVPSALRFRPPTGWNIAAEPAQAVARSADGNALLSFAAASGDPTRREDRAKILARIEELVLRLGVSGVDFARFEKRLREPDTEIEEEGSFPISLWEIGADQQQGKSPLLAGTTPGTVLVVVSTTPVGLLLVGAAFVTPEVAATEAPRVMESVKSLRLVGPNDEPGPAPTAASDTSGTSPDGSAREAAEAP